MRISFVTETTSASSSINIINATISGGGSLTYKTPNTMTISNSVINYGVSINLDVSYLNCLNSALTAEDIYLPELEYINQTDCSFNGIMHYGQFTI